MSVNLQSTFPTEICRVSVLQFIATNDDKAFISYFRYLPKQHLFFKWAIPGPVFFIFVFSKLTVDSKQMTGFEPAEPMVSEATALPTEPQPLPTRTLLAIIRCQIGIN